MPKNKNITDKPTANALGVDAIVRIFVRLIALPFYMVIALISAFVLWMKWSINFIRFGGESVVYTKKNQRKNITDIYEKLENMEKL